MTDIIYRPAGIFDQTPIMLFLLPWLEEGAVVYPSINREYGKWVNTILSQGVCFLAEKDNQIIGIIGGSLSHFPWNSEAKFLAIEWLYVCKDFRKEGLANKLINMIKQYTENYDLPLLTTLMNGVDTETKERFMRMKGFKYTGGSFYYKGDVKDGRNC